MVESGWTLADTGLVGVRARPGHRRRGSRTRGEKVIPLTTFNLEPPVKELTDALSQAPPLTGVPLADARKAVEAAQSAPIPMPDIDESWVSVASNLGDVSVRLVRPQGVAGPLPVVVYLHGGGWILG
jgi:acetyl esterase